jgi:hypothetical protein
LINANEALMAAIERHDICISDSLLQDADLEQLAEVARLLLRHGADPRPGMQIAEERYGKYDPNLPASPFMDVWHIVAKGNATG